MLDIFQPSCSGTLTASLSKQPSSGYELSWYLQISLKPVKSLKEIYDYSILVDHMLLSPINWLNLEGMEYTGSNEGSLYDGYESIHYQTFYFSLRFLERDSKIFRTQINLKFDESIPLSLLTSKGIRELNLQADVDFNGIKILESGIETSYANFTNPEWMRDFVSKYISLDCLKGPFYPFPPTEPYSKTSWTLFTPLIE